MNFKRYVEASDTWVDSHYIMGTDTDTITTLPAIIYPNDTTATVGLKGNMEQNSTPTPDNPIQPSECGDLETVGEKAGQYKIPISSASTTTPVYLGEVETTRKIKKYEFTGQETFSKTNSTLEVGTAVFSIRYEAIGMEDIINYNEQMANIPYPFFYSSHFLMKAQTGYGTLYTDIKNGEIGANNNTNDAYNRYIIFASNQYTTAADFKTYLQQQYANGTPVTVWYVLATAETGIVNEPVRKIGNYADTVSGISIPTIAGANTLSVDTTLQPSEVTANYHGWHTGAVHERENGQWD